MEGRSPVTRAFAAHDHTAIMAALSDEVVIHTPAVDNALTGVAEFLFKALLEITTPFRILSETAEGQRTAVRFQTEVGGITTDALALIEHDDRGLATDLTIYMRPLPALERLMELMGGGALTRSLEEDAKRQAEATTGHVRGPGSEPSGPDSDPR